MNVLCPPTGLNLYRGSVQDHLVRFLFRLIATPLEGPVDGKPPPGLDQVHPLQGHQRPQRISLR